MKCRKKRNESKGGREEFSLKERKRVRDSPRDFKPKMGKFEAEESDDEAELRVFHVQPTQEAQQKLFCPQWIEGKKYVRFFTDSGANWPDTPVRMTFTTARLAL